MYSGKIIAAGTALDLTLSNYPCEPELPNVTQCAFCIVQFQDMA